MLNTSKKVSDEAGIVTTIFSYDFICHLRNIRATVSDEREKSASVFLPKVQNASEYYPFGMESRSLLASDINANRFGYNGMEKDLNLESGGNILDYGARLYDGRNGRFFSIDPLKQNYPYYSSFSYCLNSPIWKIDFMGMGDPLTVMQIRKNQSNHLQGKVRVNATKPHQGFDLAAPPGTSALAVKDAEVVKVGTSDVGDYGKFVTLKILNADGVATYAYYAHIECVGVKQGDYVFEGQEVGTTGQTGNARIQGLSEAHLHFEYRSTPLLGLGLKGRLDPNRILDTKFYSQDPNAKSKANSIGVVRENPDGSMENMDIDKSVECVKESDCNMYEPCQTSGN